MIYLDNGATSFHKPKAVHEAVARALRLCANPGRGGHDAAHRAAKVVYSCREKAGKFFSCNPEQVVFTANCTHGLNLAIKTLVKPGIRFCIVFAIMKIRKRQTGTCSSFADRRITVMVLQSAWQQKV